MKTFVFISICIISSELFSQDFNNLMTRRLYDPAEITYNCSFLFEQYYSENKIDSAYMLLNYWQDKCGILEENNRANILLSIKDGTFNDSMINRNIFAYIIYYRHHIHSLQNGINYDDYDDYDYHDYHDYYRDYRYPYYRLLVDSNYDDFTQKAANDLKSKYPIESQEYLLCDFYGGDIDLFFTKLVSGLYNNTYLYKLYQFEIEENKDNSATHAAFLSGIWIPTGDAAQLGIHPIIGLQAGSNNGKLSYDFTLSFRFLNTPNYYYARSKNSGNMALTNHYFGGYIGLDFRWDLLEKTHNTLSLLSGFGYDGFDALVEDNSKGIKSESVGSTNFNFGIGYRSFYSAYAYWGIDLKFNIVNYRMNKVVDITGNTITINLVWGGLVPSNNTNWIRDLEYRE